MGVVREVDAISDAIIETEREIAGEAWGQEDTERLDASGDRALESMGGGLEGQIEQDPDESEVGDEDVDGEEEAGEGEGDEEEEADGEEGEEAQAGQTGQGNQAQQQQRREPEGRVPSGKLREAAERARLAEAERDRLRAELETAKQGGDRTEIAELKGQLAALKGLIEGQQRQPPQQRAEEPAKPVRPDIFENPDGFVDHIGDMVSKAVAPLQQQLAASRVETSMAIAHATHKDAFETAFGELNKLNPQNPDDRATVQRIYNSPNPGEELVRWHKRSTALARVGSDPDAYEARIRDETRAALLKDPEFRRQLIADMRGEAATSGPNGGPRTEPRLPRSLNRAAGSNVGGGREELRAPDGSEQAIAESAWRTG